MRSTTRFTYLMIVLAFTFTGSASAVRAQKPEPVWTVRDGLSSPESAYYHSGSNVIYVSSVAGGAAEKDGRGWISKIRPDGTVIKKKWVDGLHAPKGLRSDGEVLWVSDVDRLVGFRLDDGQKVHEISVDEARFLNDVAVGYGGSVYVSATSTNTIYRYSNESIHVFAEGKGLASPNGLLVSGRRLLVGGSSTDGNAHLVSIDLKTKDRRVLAGKPNMAVDGLELDGNGDYLVSDWSAGAVYRINPAGERTPVVELSKGTADIGYVHDENLLLIPHMASGKLLAYRIGQQQAFRDLIDESLSHWQTDGNWTVNDAGHVVLEPRAGEEGWKRFGDYLTSRKTYGNFELHVEYRIPEDGNSGVFFRVQNPSKPVTTGIEAQVLDSFDERGKLGPHDNGGIIDTSGPSRNMSRPAGSWNHMIVIARDHHLRVVLNGEQIQDLSLKNTSVADRAMEGHISLQDHGRPFRIRSIRIRELE